MTLTSIRCRKDAGCRITRAAQHGRKPVCWPCDGVAWARSVQGEERRIVDRRNPHAIGAEGRAIQQRIHLGRPDDPRHLLAEARLFRNPRQASARSCGVADLLDAGGRRRLAARGRRAGSWRRAAGGSGDDDALADSSERQDPVLRLRLRRVGRVGRIPQLRSAVGAGSPGLFHRPQAGLRYQGSDRIRRSHVHDRQSRDRIEMLSRRWAGRCRNARPSRSRPTGFPPIRSIRTRRRGDDVSYRLAPLLCEARQPCCVRPDHARRRRRGRDASARRAPCARSLPEGFSVGYGDLVLPDRGRR
ncbi:hypothetical protein ACVWWO_007365 [Bradyrhizobium sp. F1.13.1]